MPDVQNLIDMLYGMIEEAKNAPLSSDKCVIERDEALDLLEEIRRELPAELERARSLLRTRDDFVQKAKEEVERIRKQAEYEAKNKVADSEVLAAAREKSHDIIARAEERCREMYRVANEYTEDALRRTEEAVQLALKEVQQSRVRFRAASASQMQRKQDELKRSTVILDNKTEENS